MITTTIIMIIRQIIMITIINKFAAPDFHGCSICLPLGLCVLSRHYSSFMATLNHINVKAAATNGTGQRVHLNRLQKTQPAMISRYTQQTKCCLLILAHSLILFAHIAEVNFLFPGFCTQQQPHYKYINTSALCLQVAAANKWTIGRLLSNLKWSSQIAQKRLFL